MNDNYDETQKALAQLVVWIRSEVICPIHRHTSIMILTPEGPSEWHGPACEVLPEDAPECDWRLTRHELLEQAYEALGTKDMSSFLLR